MAGGAWPSHIEWGTEVQTVSTWGSWEGMGLEGEGVYMMFRFHLIHALIWKVNNIAPHPSIPHLIGGREWDVIGGREWRT